MNLEYRSFSDLANVIAANLGRFPSNVDVVVGIPRSGMIPASIVALLLNRPIADLDGFLQGRTLGGGDRLSKLTSSDAKMKRVLVIDDSIHSGTAMRAARDKVAAAGLGHAYTFAAVYATEATENLVDIALECTNEDRIFQWNILHHSWLSLACVDIDGVLCVDPTAAQNDDGPQYREFLSTALPLHIPTVEIGWLVTSRLERYRSDTEDWLARHGVRYRELRMLNLPSAEERRRRRAHAPFKAEVYRDTRASLFIESDRGQAREIAQLANRMVFSIDGWEMIAPPAGRRPSAPYRAARWAYRRVKSFLD